jgi:hypothetical protein
MSDLYYPYEDVDYWWTGKKSVPRYDESGIIEPEEGWIPITTGETFDYDKLSDYLNPDYVNPLTAPEFEHMFPVLDYREMHDIRYGKPYAGEVAPGEPTDGELPPEDTFETALANVGLGEFFIWTDPDTGRAAVYNDAGEEVWDISNLQQLTDMLQETAQEYSPFGEWVRNYGLTDLGYTISEDGQYVLDEQGNQVMTVEQWDTGGAAAKLFAPGDYSTPGIFPVDINGDGIFEQLLDADGNVIFNFDSNLAPPTDWTITPAGIVDADGNVLMDITDLPAEFDITTTDPYELMQQLASLMAAGYSADDLEAAKTFAALAFGMTAEEYDSAILQMQANLGQGIGGYEGMGETDYQQRVREIQTTVFNAENRATKMANNVWANFGSASRAYMASESALMAIHETELKGYVALAQEDYERQVANYEAEEARWKTMVEAGEMGMADYLANLTRNRAEALTTYSNQVNALLTQHAQETEAALRMREQEINVFLSKYNTDLNGYLSQQKTIMDTILAGQELLLQKEIAQYDDQLMAAQNALSMYQADMSTLGQSLEALYLAINSELGLNEAVMNFLSQQYEWDIAEWAHEWDEIMMQLEYEDLTTVDWTEKVELATPILTAIASMFSIG